MLGDESLWKKVKKLLSGRTSRDDLRWAHRYNADEITGRVMKLVEDEPDRRIRTWARVRLAAEPLMKLAREQNYADASGVHQVVRRLEATAKIDPELGRRLARLKNRVMSNVQR